MKTEKILLYSDKGRKTDLDRNAENVVAATNDLIRIYESFQPFERITTREQAEELIRDPKKRMDETLITQVNPGMVKSKMNPKAIASLVNVEYDDYIRMLRGEKVDAASCKPCAKALKVVTGRGVITWVHYNQYRNLLSFSSDHFVIDEDAIATFKKQWDYFIETESQMKEYTFWHDACSTLNELNNRGCLGGDLNSLSRTLNGLMTFSYATGKLSIDDFALFNKISNLK